MVYTIKNENLFVAVSDRGAELQSILGNDGIEYLWQGDPTNWPDRAPVLFPFIARLWNSQYSLNGKTYCMGIHGFAASSDFCLEEAGSDSLVLVLKSSAETLKQYPFEFVLRIGYRLKAASLEITYQVENQSDSVMPFGIGGHPGFRVPIVEGENYEDYIIAFSHPCNPDRIGFTENLFLSGHDEPFALENNCQIHLIHTLFDEDAIILKNMARQVTLSSSVSKRSVTVSYPDMPYLGLWHWPKTPAPYLCIEPWSSLPGRENVIEELTCKSDLIHLKPKETYTSAWSITVSHGSTEPV